YRRAQLAVRRAGGGLALEAFGVLPAHVPRLGRTPASGGENQEVVKEPLGGAGVAAEVEGPAEKPGGLVPPRRKGLGVGLEAAGGLVETAEVEVEEGGEEGGLGPRRSSAGACGLIQMRHRRVEVAAPGRDAAEKNSGLCRFLRLSFEVA